ncbi:MAG TPA: hypothetical protein ENJ37_00960 [Deltaproteobacteria bacterium]|nr:hypothetical protein [Deltaproteobacteria bacterium]
MSVTAESGGAPFGLQVSALAAGAFFFLVLLFPLGVSAEGDEVDRRLDAVEKKLDEMIGRYRAETMARKDMEEIRPKFGYNLGAFGDVIYSTAGRENANHGFTVGDLALYSTASYGGRLNFLFEMEIEIDNDYAGVELERLWVGYTFDDRLALRAGRFHTALGYWNKEYHHSRYLFVTVERPFFLQFEHDNGVMPVHIVGVEAAGAVSAADSRIRYEFEVGNGPALNTATGELSPNNTADNDDAKQLAGRLSIRPDAVAGLTLGVSATRYSLDTLTRRCADVRVLNAFTHYLRHGLELHAEYFIISNAHHRADAYYFQAAYRLNAFTPYGRYETLDSDPSDPYFSSLAGGKSRTQYIAGVKYDFSPLRAVLKLQFRRDEMAGYRSYNVVETQWAFHF